MERPIANLRFYGVSSTIVSKPANANFLALQTLTERLTHHLCSLEHYYERIDHTGKFENLISCSRYDGADDDWIVATLLHDIGDGLAPQNHDRMAAEILRPFVREEVTWVVEHHGAFQMIYYAHHLDGWNPNERDQYRDHAYYQTAVDFCERWDQNCFDPLYDSQPLAFFEPFLERVFSRKAYAPEIIKMDNMAGLPTIIWDRPNLKILYIIIEMLSGKGWNIDTKRVPNWLVHVSSP